VDRRDLRIAEALLSPEYMIPLAREYGEGDPVRGARAAWLEVRGILREWVRHVRKRDAARTDLGVSFSFKHLGVVGNYSGVLEVKEERWRQTAIQCWDYPAQILGQVKVEVGHSTSTEINYSAMRAVSKALTLVPLANRALLDGRCWQRVSPDIMVNFELGGDMNSTVFNATGKSDDWLRRKMHRAIKAARKLHKHELADFGAMLSAKWAKAGFISSPAGAMLSLMTNTGVHSGYGPLVPGNGIPVAIAVCSADDDTVTVGGTFDHRVIDGRTETRFLKTIKEEMECELS